MSSCMWWLAAHVGLSLLLQYELLEERGPWFLQLCLSGALARFWTHSPCSINPSWIEWKSGFARGSLEFRRWRNSETKWWEAVLVDVEDLGRTAENCLIAKSCRKVSSAVVVVTCLVKLTNCPGRAKEWSWLGVVTMFQGTVFCFAVPETFFLFSKMITFSCWHTKGSRNCSIARIPYR